MEYLLWERTVAHSSSPELRATIRCIARNEPGVTPTRYEARVEVLTGPGGCVYGAASRDDALHWLREELGDLRAEIVEPD